MYYVSEFWHHAVQYSKLVSSLRPEEPEDVIVSACEKLTDFFHQRPEQKIVFITQNGLFPLMELLEVLNSRVICSVLQVLNEIIKDNTDFQENACLIGLIPVVMSFAVPDRPPEVRFEAAFFLQQLCQSSSSTLQMFIACRGIPILVGFLETDYAKYREMVHMAIDGMWQVFKLKKSTSRNDFCRIAAKNGILLRLVNTLYNLDEATRLASGATGGGFSLDRLDLRPRSTSLDSSNPSLVQIDSSFYGIDRPDHFKAKQGGQTSQVGLQEPSRASVSHSSDSSSFLPNADRVSTDRWKNEPCKAEVDVKQQRGSNVVGRPSIDKARKSIDVLSNGSSTPTTSQQDTVRPQLSLLDKEPPRRHSGQLEYVWNLSGVDMQMDLIFLIEFADVSGRDRENSNVESLPKNLPRVSSKKLGRLPSNGAIAGTSRLVMRTTSGMLSSPDCKPESETSSSLLSHAVSPWNVDIAREYLEKVADLLLEFAAADTTVKSYMCSQSLLSRLLQMFDNIESQILLK
ncbi:UNVERIFIED_CONTAM: MAP3K epsilon protein kinase, partial [Sesamum radiatum]